MLRISLRSFYSAVLLTCCLILSACTANNPQPDKTVAGAVLGAAWGAGSGAIVGNQITGSPQGEGAAIGAGLGIIGGALIGAGYDQTENEQIALHDQLEELSVRNYANGQQITKIITHLDRGDQPQLAANIFRVYFNSDATNLDQGAIANLEQVGDAIVGSSGIKQIIVTGHTDDSGDRDYNKKLAQKRADVVAAYLMGRGIGKNLVLVKSAAAKMPLADNAQPAGRQLNRRVDLQVVTQ